MIERIIEGSIRNRFLVLVIAAVMTAAAVVAVTRTPIDAIPDLSENQVIVFADWMGRSPREIEDQVTYPLSLKLRGLAGVRTVRSSSEFNFSMVTIIFEEGVDYYFARQRVAEKLAQVAGTLPTGVIPYMAPDATALGQVFWYTVETDASHPLGLDRIWAINKFLIAPQLNSADGVADVAVVGGMPLEYQVDLKPERMHAYGVTAGEVYAALARANAPAGGGVIQKSNAEYIVRGIGWIRGGEEIENTVVRAEAGTPITVRQVATVQLGPQFRRGVLEKNGQDVTGGVVLMRHGENPLAVTQAVQEKFRDLRTALPEGLHIVPAYDRTRLIQGAVHTLAEVMWHEMLIASIAILLILRHVRSVLVICITLPLAVLFAFLLMGVLRALKLLDVQANIMSLAGITISIGILVDQAIVMTENATHALKVHFGDRPVAGDTRELVIPACRTVGRPIFFSVLIMLISFIPVFLLSGREGKLFHPLAYTKTFALIGVALLSVTLVPALIPTFLKGHLKSEEENWIVRSFIQIYKPLLTWALPRRNLVMWLFAALLVMATGIFPLQAILGWGASETAWRDCYLVVFALVTALTVCFTRRWYWQIVALTTLIPLGLWAYHFPKIGVAFMPALDEGTTLEMPVTVPRASVTQAVDDLKARDALLRGFPEVESVIGKAGRADTPTDPAPLDMVETFVSFRPRAWWPRRVIRYPDASRHVEQLLQEMERLGFVQTSDRVAREHLISDVTQRSVERMDEVLRAEASRDYQAFEQTLGRYLVNDALHAAVDAMSQAGVLQGFDGVERATRIEEWSARWQDDIGSWLARRPSLDEIDRLLSQLTQELAAHGLLGDESAALARTVLGWRGIVDACLAPLRSRPRTRADDLLALVEQGRQRRWTAFVHQTNIRLLELGTTELTRFAAEELLASGGASHGQADSAESQADPGRATLLEQLLATHSAELRRWVLFWPRQSGPKGDLVDDEMGRVLQMPGWSNIFTQPIINRIEMLSTGVRTDIGVKVFGPNLESIDLACRRIEEALKPLAGARDTVAAPIMGKGYIDITVDRERAARWGISVEEIQTEVEIGLGGRAVTQTVEERERFPIRVRYARDFRDDEQAIARLLIPRPSGDRGMEVNSGGMAGGSSGSSKSRGMTNRSAPTRIADSAEVPAPVPLPLHRSAPPHALTRAAFLPLSAVADIKLTEGPAMIRSENGRLLNYVTLNVRGRDMGGFVDEARRVVAQQVELPPGVHIEWSGEFEHQVRAARTLRYVFPAVIILIFLILYWTYHDLADALLMMLAVPEALAGGAFFLYLFPKITYGWDAPPLDFSVAVWVGFIACFGMATETGIIMLVYLREAIERRGGLEGIASLAELREAVIEGAAHRLRPKLLTEGVAIIAIFPMVFASGVGGEILAPMALPVLGGLLISDEVVDLFLPVRFYWVRRQRWLKLHGKQET